MYKRQALGSRLLPLDDKGLEAKFQDLAAPVLGRDRATALARSLWAIEVTGDVGPLVEAMAKPSS